MDEEITEFAVDNLSRMLLSHPQSEITGSQLGDLVAKNFPELNLRRLTNVKSGPGALTRFIDMRLKSLLQIKGKSGADVVYKINRGGAEHHAAGEEEEIIALRQLVTYAISKMTLDELRQILVPAGLAYDAARNTSKV